MSKADTQEHQEVTTISVEAWYEQYNPLVWVMNTVIPSSEADQLGYDYEWDDLVTTDAMRANPELSDMIDAYPDPVQYWSLVDDDDSTCIVNDRQSVNVINKYVCLKSSTTPVEVKF